MLKAKAINLIEEKINQFQKVLAEATYQNRYNEAYEIAYHGSESLLSELFSKKEKKDFRSNVASGGLFVVGGETDYSEELQEYKEHIKSCISQLKVYKERIQNFWEPDELKRETKSGTVPFISMSFDDRDRDINDYFTNILKALKIDFKTGERYSKDSIPQKVKNRILSSDLFIIIFVKREKIDDGGYTAPSWLFKELGIAQGKQKDVIALAERGIKDIAGLNFEKEVIYFERDKIIEIMKATVKFIEALKEHNLV
ncbi:MAG: hypothetical protein ISS41_07370 [Candidatus Aminicenantes bacterium]|nr:hypothetical protein [Candidatus Aminicenantes bacterium]